MDRKTIALKNEIRVAIESLVTRCNIKSHQGSRAKYRRIQAAPIMPQAPTRPTVGTRTRCQHVSAWQVDVNGWVGGDGENARGERMARRRTTRATERERERERERAYNRPDHDGWEADERNRDQRRGALTDILSPFPSSQLRIGSSSSADLTAIRCRHVVNVYTNQVVLYTRPSVLGQDRSQTTKIGLGLASI